MKGVATLANFPFKYGGICKFHRLVCGLNIRKFITVKNGGRFCPTMRKSKEPLVFIEGIVHRKVVNHNIPYLTVIHSQYSGTINEHKTEEIIDDITCENTEDLFSAILSDTLVINSENVLPIINKLHQIILSNLHTQHSWLIDKPHVLYMQLIWSGKIHLLDCLIKHDGFYKILSEIEMIFNTLSVDILPDILLNLIYLGLSHSHPLVHQMYFTITKSCPQYDIRTLQKIVGIRMLLEDRNPVLVNALYNRILKLIAEQKDMLSVNDFYSFCRVVTYLNFAYTSSIMKECNQFIDYQFNMNETSHSPKVIGQFLKFLNVTGYHKWYKERGQISKLVLSAITEDIIETLDLISIFVISKELKRHGEIPLTIQVPLMNRGLKLLQSDTSIRLTTLTGTLPVFTKHLSNDTKVYLEKLVLRLLPNSDFLNLVSMLHFICDTKCENPDIIHTLCVKLMEEIPQFTQYKGRLAQVLSCLSTKFHIVSKQDVFNRLQNKLIQLLPKLPTHNRIDINETVLFLLKFHEGIPQNLFAALFQIIPNSSVDDLFRYCSALTSKKYMEKSSYKYWRHASIQSCLSDALNEKLEETQTLHSSVVFMKSVLQHHKSIMISPSVNIHNIFTNSQNRLLKYMENMLPSDFIKILYLLQSSHLCSPPLLEALASYSLKNVHQLHISHYVRFIRLLASFGYIPQNSDEFSAFFIQQLDKEYDTFPGSWKIWHLVNLCYIQIYPEEYLSKVFTLESIEEIDRLIADKPYYEKSYRLGLMLLNRFAVLDCPQLNIPWFHETFLDDFQDLHYSNSQNKFQDDVQFLASEILGGPEFYRPNVSAPYGYNLDFLFHLDAKKNPVPNNLTKTGDTPGCQKVVLQPVSRRRGYCPFTGRLGGFPQMKSRHLELMGYKVINITSKNWLPKEFERIRGINRRRLSWLIFGDRKQKN